LLLSGALLPAKKLALPSSHLYEARRTATPITFITSRRTAGRAPDVLAPSRGGTNAEMLMGLDRPVEALASGDRRGGTSALGHGSGEKRARHREEA
jgi:hypothetical protein